MRILLLSTFDQYGGAATAANRLMKGLNAVIPDLEVYMLVVEKKGTDETVMALPFQHDLKKRAVMALEFLPLRFYSDRDPTMMFSLGRVSFPGLLRAINKLKPDIIHMHWINGGMISLANMARLPSPVVWTLHDMWAFTGGCHYDQHCGRFEQSCGTCPILSSNKEQDITSRLMRQKHKVYAAISDLTLVCPSRWMAEEAQRSALAGHFRTQVIPNMIDAQQFYPADAVTAKKHFGLPLDRKLVLFGALDPNRNTRKGYTLASEALNLLRQYSDDPTDLVVFGKGSPDQHPDLPFNIHYTGYITDPDDMRAVYNAADVFISPSRQENLSNMIMESLACGTPVAAFDIGGNADMIDHKKNGFLAPGYDTTQLAKGIHWLLSQSDTEQIRKQARTKVLREFDQEAVAPQFLALYESLLTYPKQVTSA